MKNTMVAIALLTSASLAAGFALSGSPYPAVATEGTHSVALSEHSLENSLERRVQQIDERITSVWDEFDLRPSREATDGEWCRRLFLDVLGRIPTVEELTEFTESREDDKKQKLVEKLLYDDNYTEEFARNWTTLWTNILIGRTGGTDNNSMISRPGMQKYLRDSFARNKSYDRMVYELITASGSTTPGEDDFNGATNFLIDKVNEEKASLATAATTKIFLGLQVQCTQCHNHPFNNWKQETYWRMNAFFRQVRAFGGGMRGDMVSARLVDQDFRGEGPGARMEEAEIFFELRNGIVKQAFPTFIDGTEIDRSGYVNVVNRRVEFAKLVLESEFMPKALVNRMWGHFMGYGFTKPVDDLGPHNIPNNPELLDFLAEEFRTSEYDMRQLISWIVLSKPYQLSSEQNSSNESDDPLLGQQPRFSQFYLRQMQAEQLYESLLIATQAGESRGSYEEQEQLKSRWLQQFSQAFGTDEGDETTSFNGTIPQVLMMFNGDLMRTAISTDRGSLIDRLVRDDSMSDKERLEYLFLAGLSREPSREESEIFKQIYHAREGNLSESLRDMWWIILNTNEFIFNH